MKVAFLALIFQANWMSICHCDPKSRPLLNARGAFLKETEILMNSGRKKMGRMGLKWKKSMPTKPFEFFLPPLKKIPHRSSFSSISLAELLLDQGFCMNCTQFPIESIKSLCPMLFSPNEGCDKIVFFLREARISCNWTSEMLQREL